MPETLQQRIDRVTREEVALTDYNPRWPEMFEEEKAHLLGCLPGQLLGRIEHFGSTAVPGLCAKPVVDMLVEVSSLEETKKQIVPVLEEQRYDYFWRPSLFEGLPFYAWFIKRDRQGKRTHHIHMVESHFDHWQRLYFRDYLIEFPDVAREYHRLKRQLADQYPGDRIAYTRGKTEFIVRVTEKAKAYYKV